MFLTFIHSAIRFSTTFLFGSTGETITERSGHLNLGIPGIMCLGAVGGCIGESLYLKGITDYAQINGFGAVIIGILFAMMFAGAGGLIYAFLTITLRSNQNVSGLAMTTFGVGLTNFLIPQVNKTGFYYISVCFTNYAPGADKAGWFSELFLTYGCLVYVAIVLAILVAAFIKRSRTGLNLRAVGENPGAADAAGINVIRYKYVACVLGAAIAGLGGLFFIFDYLGGNWEYTIESLGWLSRALVIFSVWRPNIGIAGSIFFGALFILPAYVTVGFAYNELIKMIPYVVTIIVLIATSLLNKKETQPPASLGIPYFREER